MTALYEAVREINVSDAFKNVLAYVLELGNILNTGNQRLSLAVGFDISYLKEVKYSIFSAHASYKEGKSFIQTFRFWHNVGYSRSTKIVCSSLEGIKFWKSEIAF